jgi:hypothetical protein
MNRDPDATTARVVFAALALCLMGACSRDSGEGDVSPAASGATTVPVSVPAATTAEAESAQTNCTRGEPEPILATGSEFKRSGEQGSETFVSPNGTDWSIRQFGCDHFAVEFTLTSKDEPSPTDLPAWTAQQFASLKVAESSQPIVAAISNGIKEATSSLGEPAQLSETETLTVSKPESAETKVVVLYDVAI